MGDFITVRLMSGGQSASVGLMISNQISLLQYPAACANAVVLLAVVLLMIAAILRMLSTVIRQGICEGDARTWIGPLASCSAPSSRLFVLFLYGPTLTIVILSFQGPDGGLTFPMNGVSLHWFAPPVRTAGGRRFRRLAAALAACWR